MPLKITFELSDEDLERFAAMAINVQKTIDPVEDAEKIIAATKELLKDAKNSKAPEFISNRLNRLELLSEMRADEEWLLPEENSQRIIEALTYFAESEDLISDRIPGIGFLDDAIMADLIFKDLEAEVTSYLEFCAFRSGEERRLKEAGLSTEVDRETWLADKRTELHSKMKDGTQSVFSTSAWRAR